MRPRRRRLWLALLAPAALVSGCRNGAWDFNPFASALETAWEADLQKNETPVETEERRWRESRKQ